MEKQARQTEGSGFNMNKDVESRPISEHNKRYQKFSPSKTNQEVNRSSQDHFIKGERSQMHFQSALENERSVGFNDEEDFRLSTDNQTSLANIRGINANASQRGISTHIAGSESSRLVKDRLNILNSRTSREMANIIDEQFDSQRQLGEGLKRQNTSDNDLSRDENFASQMTRENEQDAHMSRK
jgi:hypothetical protein